MGRTGDGIEVRATSIRITLPLPGRPRETLYVNGLPLPPTPPNIAYARRVATEIRKKLALGTFVYAHYFPHSKRVAVIDAPEVVQFMRDWLELQSFKKSTARGYGFAIESFWATHFAGKRVDEVRHSDVLRALKKAATDGRSAKTRNNYLVVARGAFRLALRDKRIGEDPTVGIENSAHQAPKADPFSLEEAWAIIRGAYAHYPEPIGNYCQAVLFSGMRTGEAQGVHWEQVGLAERVVKIDRALTLQEVKSVKTDDVRLVKLNRYATEAFERQKAWSFLAGGRVFTDPRTGKPWADDQAFRKGFWIPLLKRLGLRYRSPYEMRHTYATVGLMSGARPGFLAKQLGHGLRVFFEVYADWISSADDERELDKIDDAIETSLARSQGGIQGNMKGPQGTGLRSSRAKSGT